MSEVQIPEDFRQKLLSWPETPVFVALDGALFGNLPRLLEEAKFDFLSLFLGQTDPEIVRAAPQFVMVSRDRLAAFLEIPRITKGAVFWNAPGCERLVFFRHLRSPTMTRIPMPEERSMAEGRKTRAVVFRHFDPGTVVITLPVMTLPQRGRMFGPAQSLLIDAPEGILEAKRRSDWPEPELGRLSFSQI